MRHRLSDSRRWNMNRGFEVPSSEDGGGLEVIVTDDRLVREGQESQ